MISLQICTISFRRSAACQHILVCIDNCSGAQCFVETERAHSELTNEIFKLIWQRLSAMSSRQTNHTRYPITFTTCKPIGSTKWKSFNMIHLLITIISIVVFISYSQWNWKWNSNWAYLQQLELVLVSKWFHYEILMGKHVSDRRIRVTFFFDSFMRSNWGRYHLFFFSSFRSVSESQL